jgi:hypothetical protein
VASHFFFNWNGIIYQAGILLAGHETKWNVIFKVQCNQENKIFRKHFSSFENEMRRPTQPPIMPSFVHFVHITDWKSLNDHDDNRQIIIPLLPLWYTALQAYFMYAVEGN